MGQARGLVAVGANALRAAVAAALESAGWTTRQLRRAADVPDALADEPFDLAVLDVESWESAIDVTRAARAEASVVPLLFLGPATERSRPRWKRVGLDDHLARLFSLDEIVARAEAALRRTRTAVGSGRYVCGNMELDDDSYAVWVDGDIVSLSPTQFRLLRFMLRNQGRILSKEELVSNVWDVDFAGSPAVVETYMSTLRRKVDPSGRLIVTKRGLGYQLGE